MAGTKRIKFSKAMSLTDITILLRLKSLVLLILLLSFTVEANTVQENVQNLPFNYPIGKVSKVEIFCTADSSVYISRFNKKTKAWGKPIAVPSLGTRNYEAIHPTPADLDQFGIKAKAPDNPFPNIDEYIWDFRIPVAAWNMIAKEPDNNKVVHEEDGMSWKENQKAENVNVSSAKKAKNGWKNYTTILGAVVLGLLAF
ncbi:hypothetical protein ENBRE01_0170 [Enteropsectra breve]|nr:hypothetical protein ENBRE01_0170 [Enteropsectra breve]